MLAVLTDRGFLTAYADELGARLDGVATSGPDDARRTELQLRVPTRGIPPAFARFVGAEVAVADVRTWRPDGDGGYAADTEVRARSSAGTPSCWAPRRSPPTPERHARHQRRPGHRGRARSWAGRRSRRWPSWSTVVLRREAELLRRRLADGGRASSSP